MGEARKFTGAPPRGVLLSVGATAALLLLLHRAMRQVGAKPDFLFLSAANDLDALECGFVLGVAAACAWALLRVRRDAVPWIQLSALGLALALTQYRLGSEVQGKVDLRYLQALMSGVVSLFSSYLCVLTHVLLEIKRRR